MQPSLSESRSERTSRFTRARPAMAAQRERARDTQHHALYILYSAAVSLRPRGRALPPTWVGGASQFKAEEVWLREGFGLPTWRATAVTTH